MTRTLLLAAALFLAVAAKRAPSPLDGIAADYVHLTLEAGEREEGYVDAYYGPKDWAEAAKAKPRDVATLRTDAHALVARLDAVKPATLTPEDRIRQRFLTAQLKAAETRLAMMAGTKFSFADEAEGLFAVRPQLKPLAAYDPALAKIAAIVPGDGPLWQRVDDWQNRFVIPTDKLEPVMRAAIAECRARTVAHIKLPAQERFELEFVTGKSWSGYNWYKGDAHSLIQVNTDLPVRIDRAVDLGCHEGYPGHHALNMLLERNLARARGWVEFTVYPLFSPQSFIAEGSANAGIDLAFPGAERARFEASRLYPIAGLDPAGAAAYDRLLDLLHQLAGARMTIAAMYLDGKVDRSAALDLIQKYQLVSRKRAEQSLSFTENYRSYVINYGLGQDMVTADLARAGRDSQARWKRMEAIISQPTLPADLRR
ncbi:MULTISPECIES: hypothetical protein [unclassified Sphingomonas]|uniref:hypothetical protein n=1 Tax=unclassified Sphingomonas TaxID=196159 RepID=UPI0006F385C7|nr:MULTISPECIES: hypothetical protein [unclassified Sphingomonas]KQX26325.1 hypothetical protein ASD17_02465 [Sphingomonas sp. Root1294]KQY69396.1 hypothetical protein ASD39_03675 [Sphingomonas sp. Root50]KRB89654.1 hypothetical protein ASE22_18585 [Sphingomonas sp. Root720]